MVTYLTVNYKLKSMETAKDVEINKNYVEYKRKKIINYVIKTVKSTNVS